MEYFDILDEKGEKTGKTKLRKEVHRDGDFHKAVDIWILNSKGELLLQKRSITKESYPNMWEVSCSGHIAAGEKSLPSAIRELEEELGISVEEKDLEYKFTVKEKHVTNNNTFINNEFKDIYLLKKDFNLSDFKLQEDEVSEVKFLHFKDLESIVNGGDKNFVPHKESYEKLFEILKSL